MQVFRRHRQHTARTRRRVVQGPHDAGLGESRVVLGEQQFHHELDDFAGGVVLARRLVAHFREAAQQFLEKQPHLVVADRVRVQVDVGKLFGDEVEQVGLVQALDGRGEVEAQEDVLHFDGEGPHVGLQVVAQVLGVSQELRQAFGEEIEEGLSRRAPDELGEGELGRRLGLVLGQCRRPRRGQHAIEAPQHGEGQDDPPVFRLLEVAAQ